MAIGIDPTVDYAFKLLLGSPEHPTITLHFLNAILGNEIQINSVETVSYTHLTLPTIYSV